MEKCILSPIAEGDKMSDLEIRPDATNSLRLSVRQTLNEVLNDRVLNETFGGSDQRLSSAQAGLACAVDLPPNHVPIISRVPG